MTVTGTATDSGGGVVAAVEVSVDGGTTWRAAQGTASWTFEWFPGVPGSFAIRTRAMDDSGNRETPGAGTTVTIGGSTCPCTTLLSPSSLPAIPDVDDTSAVELGMKFRTDVDGFITGVRFYKSANNIGTHVGNLWTSTGTLLAHGNVRGLKRRPAGSRCCSTRRWRSPQTRPTSCRITPTSDTIRRPAAYFAAQGTDRPPLHAPASGTVGGNGVYCYGATAFPTDSFNATNYWVDVVFSSTVDTMAPTIAGVVATPVDGSSAIVTWNTDEASNSRVDYATDRTFPAATTLSVSDPAMVTAHSVRLTGLSPSTLYSSASGPSTAPATRQRGRPCRRPARPRRLMVRRRRTSRRQARRCATRRRRTSAPARRQAPTFLKRGDGELILAPASATEFSGSALPADWSTSIWSPGGTAAVAGGRLTVDGARVAQEPARTVMAGHSLEFVATFTGDPYQHSGLGQSLATTVEPLALFSTSWTDAQGVFQARWLARRADLTGSDPAGETRTNLGIGYINAPHRYRIDWLPGRSNYFVDGVQVASHAVAIAGPMRPVAASDYTAFAGTIVVDWVRSTPYASAGTFLSRVFGATSRDQLAEHGVGVDDSSRHDGRDERSDRQHADAGWHVERVRSDCRTRSAQPAVAVHPVPRGAGDV